MRLWMVRARVNHQTQMAFIYWPAECVQTFRCIWPFWLIYFRKQSNVSIRSSVWNLWTTSSCHFHTARARFIHTKISEIPINYLFLCGCLRYFGSGYCHHPSHSTGYDKLMLILQPSAICSLVCHCSLQFSRSKCYRIFHKRENCKPWTCVENVHTTDDYLDFFIRCFTKTHTVISFDHSKIYFRNKKMHKTDDFPYTPLYLCIFHPYAFIHQTKP